MNTTPEPYPYPSEVNGPPNPPAPTAKPKTKRTVIIAAVVFLLGLGIGAASASGETKVETKTVTVTKEVEVVPQSCLEALDAGDAAFGTTAEAFGIMAELLDVSSTAFQSLVAGDLTTAMAAVDDMERLNADLNRASDQLDPQSYTVPRDACRSAAG